MLSIFVKRPILSTVISIIIVILGVLGIFALPIEQYPDIAPPTVRITATYTGANAETILNSVITPIEEAVNGVEGMTYMTSTSSNDGVGTINVFFNLGINPDIAAVNVQNRVQRAYSQLPSTVVETGVTVLKSQNGLLMVMSLYSDNKDFDETFIQNYARINLLPVLQRVKGMGDVTIFGAKDYSMRIWLDPDKMSNFNLMPSDIQAALREQNVESAAGRFGENAGNTYEYVIKYKGRLSTVEEYENIIVKSLGNNQFLRLKDVAKVELGAFNYGIENLTMSKPGVVLGMFQTPGSNASDIIEEVESIIKVFEQTLPKGIHYILPFNSKDFLDASIEKITRTLVEAFLLVFVVVFIFLQNFRATLIPIISVPVSIIGTFFFLNLFGYTINTLTLFALVLSIGIVVDDAIVVVEAIYSKLEAGYKSSRSASINAINEIFGAIVSITLVLVAVFVPVMFIKGSTGLFYQQFAITLTISILISAVNALTLSPALCAIFLKPHQEHGKKRSLVSRFFMAFNVAFEASTQKYLKIVKLFSKRKWMPIGILVAAAIATVWLFQITPKGFIPNEDRGNIFVEIGLAPGSSLSETEKVVKQYDSVLNATDMIVGQTIIIGRSLLFGISGPSYAFSVLKLKDWSLRTAPENQVDGVIAKLRSDVQFIKNARFVFFSPPTIRGFGFADGFEFKLLSKGEGPWSEMDKTAKDFLANLRERPEIRMANSAFNASFPQYEAVIDVDRVKNAGLSLTNVLNALQGYYAGLYTTDFNRFGKQYRVMIQGAPESRVNPESLDHVYVVNRENKSASLSQFITVKRIYAPEYVERYNLLRSINVTGASNAGYSTGDAIKAIQEVAAEKLPSNYTYEFTGLSREEIISGGQSVFVFLLSFVFVYFILSALYESYVLPLAVILSLVIGVFGALFFVKFLGMENNIYFQVALIMLLGLLAKNGILIVEVALQKRLQGMLLYDAAIYAAKTRLRPILMTSFAFILGILPLAFAKGIGSVGNRSIGTGAMGGLLVGTFLGILVVPVLFIIFQGLHEKISGQKIIEQTPDEPSNNEHYDHA